MLGIEESALVERAATIRPILERNAEKTDSLRRLADENVQALKDAGLCRLMVPARFGGHQTSVRTYIDVMAELGRGCGSTSWVASLINVCAWLTSLFPERAQTDIWGVKIPMLGLQDRYGASACAARRGRSRSLRTGQPLDGCHGTCARAYGHRACGEVLP